MVAFGLRADDHAKIRLGSPGTGCAFGEVAERLPLVAFGPRGRGSSREMRRSCHVISFGRKTWSRLIRARIITRKTGCRCVTLRMCCVAR